MSTIADFNRIEDCDKIDPLCVDSYTEFKVDPDNETGICLATPWGGNCIDLEPLIKAGESCTTMYLSPDEDPNCLVYEPEEQCGDNVCIHGDDLSRIISMQYLKDVEQTEPTDGIVYMYNSQTNLFEPYDLKTTINNINTAITNLQAAVTNLTNRVSIIEEKITPPAGTPDDARILHGNINIYSDYNAVVNSSGTATSLNKNHGVYGHALANDIDYDELMG